MRRLAIIVFIAMVGSYLIAALVGCESIQVVPAAVPSATPVPAAKPSGIALAWGHADWSDALFIAVKENLPSLDKAKDAKAFCPKYAELLPSDKVIMWSTFVVAIAKFESNYNPLSKYQEPPPPKGPGTLSQGLLQISVGDKAYHGACDGITKASLYDPFVNIRCGVRIMGRLIERDGVISVDQLGLARYWSVIRSGHHINEIAKVVSSISVCH